MAEKRVNTEKKKLSDRIASFIEKNRKLLISLVIVGVVVIVAVAILTSVSQSRKDKAIVLSEQLQDYYNDYSSAEDSKKAGIKENLLDAYEELTTKYKKTYGAQRAYYIMANVYWEEEDWLNSAQTFRIVGERFPESYLAPVCLQNAAAAYEQAGDTDQALVLYNMIIKNFTTDPAAPKAYFSAARVNEQTGNNEEALRLYNEILQEYQTSNWTKFARSRIIQLELETK